MAKTRESFATTVRVSSESMDLVRRAAIAKGISTSRLLDLLIIRHALPDAIEDAEKFLARASKLKEPSQLSEEDES